MALQYLAGDLGELVFPFNPENKYPACAGVSFDFGTLSILYFHEKPQTVDTAPPGIASFFQKMGQSTQAKPKTVKASINDEVESLTLLSQEMFKDKNWRKNLGGGWLFDPWPTWFTCWESGR